jgi:hypothetical protein
VPADLDVTSEFYPEPADRDAQQLRCPGPITITLSQRSKNMIPLEIGESHPKSSHVRLVYSDRKEARRIRRMIRASAMKPA